MASVSRIHYAPSGFVEGDNIVGAGRANGIGLAGIDPHRFGQEDDGRWWAEIESMPGVMAYGPTREAAISAVRALALRVAADCIDHGEQVPPQFENVFSIA